MKYSFFLLLVSMLSFQAGFSQDDSTKQDKDSASFYLTYSFAGLGSNIGKFMPTIRIHDSNLVYTHEQNSYWAEKDKRIDTISQIKFRQSSIDSIYAIVQGLPDTTIFKSHLGAMSGGIHFLTIKHGKDSIHFELMNTFDYTALKIANILNLYLPVDQQLWANEEMIVDAEAYMAKLFEQAAAEKTKKKKKQHQKHKH